MFIPIYVSYFNATRSIQKKEVTLFFAMILNNVTFFFYSSEDDTFSFWAPNRSALEYADFENLRRKLSDVQLSKELTVLLQSLA